MHIYDLALSMYNQIYIQAKGKRINAYNKMSWVATLERNNG
jgi:hypothetical protein